MSRWFCLVLATLLLSGCAHYISEDSLQLANPAIPFSAVEKNPDRYLGTYLFVGGIIAGVTNGEGGGQLEIVQLAIDSYGRPIDFRFSEGRFLAQTDHFIDPAIYKPGMSVSLVGQVKGKKVQTLDKIPYTYPVLAVREMHLWQSNELYGSQTPYGFYYFPFDYPYDYGMCDFGYGPYPYYYGWDAGRCFLYNQYPFLPPDFIDRDRHHGHRYHEPPAIPNEPREFRGGGFQGGEGFEGGGRPEGNSGGFRGGGGGGSHGGRGRD
jgi:outer membrane lipoprotein